MFRYIYVIGIFVISSSIVSAQTRVSIENLVFEGAGIRGIAYCGALSELEQHGLNKEIKRVAGTSAGAIMAMAVSIGYTSYELADIISNTNFIAFNESLTDNDWERTVSISDAAIGPKMRKLSKTEVQQLIENGRKAMTLYLQNNSNDTAAND